MLNVSTMTREELEAVVAKLSQDAQRKLTLKVSDKGGISLYGIGRFPASFYLSQWEKIAEVVKSGQLERFIEANRSVLSVKQ